MSFETDGFTTCCPSRDARLRIEAGLAAHEKPLLCAVSFTQSDPLPSWSEGATKTSIISFVARVTKEGGPDFVAPEARIATFDNDGTHWVEQPPYIQLMFALEEIKRLAPKHPEWANKEPFRSVIAGDMKGVMAGIVNLIARQIERANFLSEPSFTTIKKAPARHST
ncbi:hypothetical protein GCM10007874_36910 [Labrys miyagiensis]|uniref:Uncharacterized protein n=1 Tax=Labrys miyagiensis TaxID=346912 RepID=A0ABQ6CLP6_9HYPH|nr:hypothetical protein GCM10007874_36910 [Labrys miyagiensis]